MQLYVVPLLEEGTLWRPWCLILRPACRSWRLTIKPQFDITQLKTIGPWEGTLTVLPLPPVPGLWLSAPGCTFALGTDVVIVIAGQEYPAVVVGRSPDDEGGVYQVALQGTAGPLQR